MAGALLCMFCFLLLTVTHTRFCRFLQFGSPHSVSSQAQYIVSERNEIWVNIGYRLSAFGFLACDAPTFVGGNFGFKDQWCALEWIRNNISAFGGTSDFFLDVLY